MLVNTVYLYEDQTFASLREAKIYGFNCYSKWYETVLRTPNSYMRVKAISENDVVGETCLTDAEIFKFPQGRFLVTTTLNSEIMEVNSLEHCVKTHAKEWIAHNVSKTHVFKIDSYEENGEEWETTTQYDVRIPSY